MGITEIQNLLNQIKTVMPTFSIPDMNENDSEEELETKLSVYIMAFGNLRYGTAVKALNKIMFDENLLKQFKNLPIPTLARETVKITEFSEAEKQKYINSKEYEYAVDNYKGVMLTINKGTHQREPEHDRPMNNIEYDFYMAGLMSLEEYKYFANKKDKNGESFPKPKFCLYDPITRSRRAV